MTITRCTTCGALFTDLQPCKCADLRDLPDAINACEGTEDDTALEPTQPEGENE